MSNNMREELMRKVEVLRDLHFDADGEFNRDEFNRGARYAIKQIVRLRAGADRRDDKSGEGERP